MNRELEEQSALLRRDLMRMASLAERMLHRSIQAMVLRNEEEAAELPEMELQVNRLQIEIDDRAARILALQQPLAHDLRIIVSAMKIGSELERIADQAINIRESASILMHLPARPPVPDLLRMADLSQKMLGEAIEALAKEDSKLAEMIVLRDDEVDALKDLILRQLMRQMINDVHMIQDSLQIILVSTHLERVADHATNIAENVIYIVEARDIRHHSQNGISH